MYKSKNSNEEKDRSLKLNIHSNRVHGKRVLFSSRVESSFPSKVRQFHSHQINHIRHKGGSEDWKRLYLFKAGRSTLFVHYQGLQRVRKTKYRPDNHIPKICQMRKWWPDNHIPNLDHVSQKWIPMNPTIVISHFLEHCMKRCLLLAASNFLLF